MRRPITYITARQNRHAAMRCDRGVECAGPGCKLQTGKTAKRKVRSKA